MKQIKIKVTNLLLILLIGLFLSSLNSSIGVNSAEIQSNEIPEYPSLQALTPHGPIYIEYDSNFTDYSFPGTGAPGDPYRIENYNITVSGDYPILFSGNNTEHFVIQNCFLWSDTNTGIYLGKYYDMGEGTVSILNNIITTAYNPGIDMVGGNYSVISGNTIDSEAFGMDIVDSDFTTVSENIVTSKNEGIYVEYSQNMSISRNTCFGSNDYAIFTEHCSNTVISYNNCSNNYVGMFIYEAYNDTITNNILVNNTNNGIDASHCYDTVFKNNLLQNNTDYGIYIMLTSADNILHHNAFIDNNGGGVQANDDGSNNIWFDTVTLEGNFYSDWVSGSYSIDGTSSSVDPYPLNAIPEIPEFSNMSLAILLVASISAYLFFRRRKN